MIDSMLPKNIEDVILFGKQDELESMVGEIREKDLVPEDLQYALESLSFFRSHYASVASQLSEHDREIVVKYDADWAMQIIQRLNGRCSEDLIEKSA